MEISIKMSCGCKCRWHDLDVPPTLGSPAYCSVHGDVDIADVIIAGVTDFYVRDMNGDWWHRGERLTDDELASKLEHVEYNAFPCFTKSVPSVLIIIQKGETDEKCQHS